MKTQVLSTSALSTAYGPHANEAAFDVTAADVDAYAPPSEQDLYADADELSLARRPVLRPDLGWMAVDMPDEGFLTAVDDLHRTVRVQGEHRPVDLHREILAPAERAADAGEVDAHLLGLQSETRRTWLRSWCSHCVAT